jgi:hypothetical protein
MKRSLRQIATSLLMFGIANAVAAAVLSVDGDASRAKPINPHIYGVNIANWCQHYYLKLCEPMLTNAGVTLVRFGATNMERYNWRNNRMYNVISKQNQFVPMSWESFVEWVRNDLGAEVFLQAPVFGHVAADYGASDYNTNQTLQDIREWVAAAGTNVAVWGVGNEPFIAWKLEGYAGQRGDESYAYNDGAHGDQVFNEDIAADVYFPRFLEVASSIRAANTNAIILGPTPANWWLYWSTDYSPFCPATRAAPGNHTNHNGWFTMAAAANQWDPRVFPDRGGSPDLVGWERNPATGAFNDQRVMCQFVKRVAEYAAANGGTQVCNYLDFHRYMNCDQDAVAVQEVRDLWDPDYASYDRETGASGTKTEIFNRFQRILDHYYSNRMYLSLSEYDYFYWQGHPAEPQVAALGQADYLGTFAKHGVQLACNWYIGEPDQSGGGYHHAADAAKQAMFNEVGEPNPKYWAFKLMSENFRDLALMTESSDRSAFSVYAGLDTASSQLVVAAFYKGQYYPWYDEHFPGAFIEGQPASNATIIVSNFTIRGVHSVRRFGRYDPEIIHMDTGGVAVAGNQFTYTFEPLAIYLFRFYGTTSAPAESAPASFLNVKPARVDFGPYETGIELEEEEDHETHEITIRTNLTRCITITNHRNSNTTWSVSASSSWLGILSATSGTARVTDRVFIAVTNRNLAVGVYSSGVQVATSEGSVWVPVTMEVLPGEAGGEMRLFDAETHSLAHAWGDSEPYSLGVYDGHGNTEDRNAPYIYTFSMDYGEVSPLGGCASLRVDFDRTAGDNSAGRLYSAFGTYGHYAKTMCWVPTNANPSNYVFKFDIKTKTEGTGFTKTRLLVVITDDTAQTNKGKPNVLIDNFKQSIELEDGVWQTIAIPLSSEFYDWKYPGGQDGRLVALDFSRIRQVEFCPWVGREDKKGVMWLDNLRIETVDAASNHYPVAAATPANALIGTSETVQLSATNSFDEDGHVAAYRWSPGTGLSATNAANVTFSPPSPGVYTFNLVVTDDKGLSSRNPAQVVVKVIPTLVGTSLDLYRDVALSDPVGAVASNSLDLYVKLTCSSGGDAEERDFTLARVSTDDTYGPDDNNRVNDINIVLEETAADSKVFVGHVRLAAFSDELSERIGASEGAYVTVSNAGVSARIKVGKQTYGHEKFIDHIERGNGALNNFEGPWYAYNDNYNANTSVVYMATSNAGARSTSSQCMHGWGTLRLGPTGSVDRLFAGIGTKLTRLSEETTNAVYDLSSTTGARGVSFWLKGNGKRLSVVLRSMIITNYDDYLYTIENTPTNGWRKYQLLFTDFAQEGWGCEAVERDTALRYVNSVQFKFASKINGETNHVFVDDLALFGGAITYSSNVIYRKDNTCSMEGFGGIAITNASFTNAGGSATTIAGWTLAGNVRGEDWGANGGDAVFEWWNGGTGSIHQDVPGIVTGRTYRFRAAMSRSSDFDGAVYLDVIWLTATNSAISTNSTGNIAPGITTADWPPSSHETALCVAPANAAKARVRIRAEGVTSGNAKAHDAEIVGDQLPDNNWQTWVDGFAVTYTNDCAEGYGAAVLSSTNTDWVAGMFVPDVWQTPAQHMTNFSAFDGLAIKARRAPGYAATGGAHARIRIGMVTGETEVAKTRWYPVDGSEWEDSIVFSKNEFFTLATADSTNPLSLVVWSNDWSAIDRVYIYFGPSTNGLTPYKIMLDNFRPCAGTFPR